MNFNFYSEFFTRINTTVDTFISETAADFMSSMQPFFTTALVFYVAWWGYTMMYGMINEPLFDALKRMTRIILVYSIATNINLYNDFLADWLWRSPEALGQIVIGSSTIGGGATDQFLDNFLSEFYKTYQLFVTAAYKDSSMGIPNIELFIGGCIVLMFGLILTLFVAYLFVLSKIALAILLAIGPIFVFFITFNTTKKFFDAWIGQIITFILTVLLASLILNLIISLIKSYLVAANALVATATPTIDQIIPIIAFCAIATLVLRQVASIASALGEGIAISTLGGFGKAVNSVGKAAKSTAITTTKAATRTVTALKSSLNKNTIRKG